MSLSSKAYVFLLLKNSLNLISVKKLGNFYSTKSSCEILRIVAISRIACSL